MGTPSRPLRELALLHSIQPSYRDASGQRRRPSSEGLLGALRALGVPLERESDAADALRERRAALCARPVEPVTVWWERGPFLLSLRVRRTERDGPVTFRIVSEEGDEVLLSALEIRDRRLATDHEREAFERVFRFARPPLPFGYHTLHVESPGLSATTRLIVAPERAYATRSGERMWGLFAPLYALRSRRDWGVGDLTDLAMLIREIASLGGSGVATLPLLATFLSEPFEPSPYSPVSRLFWNELFLDPTRTREFASSPAARERIGSAEFAARRDELRSAGMVDYAAAMRLKRSVLEILAAEFFDRGGDEARSEFDEFLADHPRAESYARFRAALEHGRWPGVAPADGLLELPPEEEPARKLHLYVQWQCVRQLESISALARSTGFGLYLDFPLGVHGGGYDAWIEDALFAKGASAGAPPDPFFTGGQNWGFPPLHPERLRESGYRYFIESLRTAMRHAGVLRFDHVMALHRLFWIPNDLPASAGVYVRYPADELFAILAIESHRHRTLVVGEDLGTVPAIIRSKMERHGVRRMYVLQYEVGPQARVGTPSPGSVASLNTHDMPPFAGFWSGKDIEERARHGHVRDVEEERRTRSATRESLAAFLDGQGLLEGSREDVRAVYDASMAFVARSDAALVLVNAEDLWLSVDAQNLPGTHREHPNWQRKLARPTEDLTEDSELAARLRQLDSWRRRGRTR